MSFVLLAAAVLAGPPQRTIPAPLPDHSDYVWLVDQPIVMERPPHSASWRVVSVSNDIVAEGQGERVEMAPQPVGYYELQGLSAAGEVLTRTGLAVLRALERPTPLDSPICLDVATAWFYPREQLAAVASQCALAGVNWVRDRLSWGEVETGSGVVVAHTKYDETSAAMTAAGLQELQVYHSSPAWTGEADQRHMASDLRFCYDFHRRFGERWKDTVAAWEPWNEGDIDGFGGHAGAELAAWQKAAWWGIRASGSDAVVGHNCLATWRTETMADLAANQSYLYCDTFNFHHYGPVDSYAQLYEKMDTVSGGRPLWVTEAGTHVRWTGDETEKEPSPEELERQARFVTQSLAASVAEGSAATFFFVMPNYAEGQVQFGLTRRDRSPRPAYVALAAAGRLLAGARSVGAMPPASRGDLRLYGLQARPDGRPALVLVAWSVGEPITLPPWVRAERAYDHFGRDLPVPTQVGSDPVYLVCDSRLRAPLESRARPVRDTAKPSPLVLQPLPGRVGFSLDRSAWRIAAGQQQSLPVYAYNFGTKPIRTTVRASSDQALVIVPRSVPLIIAPGERIQLDFVVSLAATPDDAGRLNVRFQAATSDSESVASIGYLVPLSALHAKASKPVAGADVAANWETMVSPGTMTITAGPAGTVEVMATMKPGDRWAYPRLPITAERAPAGYDGVAFEIVPLEGQATYRFIADEENGANYLATADFEQPLVMGQTYEAVLRFSDLMWGPFSPADANNRFDPEQMIRFKIGLNSDVETVRYRIGKVRWLRFGG